MPIASTSSAPGRSLPLVRARCERGYRAVAGLVSRHGAAPGANCAEPSNAGVQDRLVARSPVATNLPSKITARGSSLSTRPTATGAGQPLARTLPHLRPAPRSIASHRCKAPPGHARSGDTLVCVSPDTCVLRRVLVVPSTVCLRGSLGVGRAWQMVMILGTDHNLESSASPQDVG